MIIALIGSHGTGKTTVFERLRKEYPELQFFTEQVRHQIPKFGYKDPYQIIDKHGIAAFELMNINAWSVIDTDANTTLRDIKIVTERSAIDNYAYYLTHRSTKFDYDSEEILKNMARYYASLISVFIYFPIGKIPLRADLMRKDDLEYQLAVDKNIRKTLRMFGIGGKRVYRVRSVTIDDRAQEVAQFLESILSEVRSRQQLMPALISLTPRI